MMLGMAMLTIVPSEQEHEQPDAQDRQDMPPPATLLDVVQLFMPAPRP